MPAIAIKWHCFSRLVLERQAIIRTQNPAILNERDAPQPDVAFVRWRDDYYRKAHSSPTHILLAIEIAWSSARGDREVKAPLYASVGIPEFWPVDIGNSRG